MDVHALANSQTACTTLKAGSKAFAPFQGACNARSRKNRVGTCRAMFADETAPQPNRRDIILSTLSAVTLLSATPSKAGAADEAAAPAGPYTDPRDNYKIQLPEGWSLSEGTNAPGTGPTATRRTVAWYEPGNPSTYITVVCTNVGADYTSLGSFGNAQTFGENLVGSMDQSFLARAPKWAKGNQPHQEAKLLKALENDKAYNIEYTIKRSDEDQRHLLSTVAIGYNGRYTRLYTLTAVSSEENFAKEKATLQKIVDSFQPPYVRTT